MPKYISPKHLKEGDRVAIIAPAEAFVKDELVEGLDIIREMGLVPVLGPNVRKMHVDPPFAAPLEDRVKEFDWAFSDPSFAGVIPVVGGLGSAELLPHVDFSAVRKSRKAFLGMSDISALNNGILVKAGLVTINGQSPSIRVDKGEKIRKSDSESLRFALELMMSDEPWDEKPMTVNTITPRTVVGGKVTGHAIGCNLDTFTRLIGTEFMPDAKGAILFVEDTHRGTIDVNRQLIHLKLCGLLDDVAGVVIGEFVDVPKNNKRTDPTMDQVIDRCFGDLGIPVMYGLSFSHGPYTMPIPVGANVKLDADALELSFDFSMS